MVNVLPVPVAMATSIWRLRSRDRLLDRGVRLELVGPQTRVICSDVPANHVARGVEVAVEQFAQGVGRVEAATWRERFSGWRTSWNQITSPLVE